MNKDQKVALVTGGARRIGAAIANELHRSGHDIIIHYGQSKPDAEQLQQQLNGIRPNSCHLIQADLIDDNDVETLAKEALAIYGHLDALINNASSFYPTRIENVHQKDWDALINSNVKAAFFLSTALAPTLKKRQGCITNIIDIHSEKPLSNHSVYCIAKAGLAMMTKSLAKELAPEVRVNGVSPGAILWPEQELSDDEKSAILKKVPLQRPGDRSDIARTVAFLVDNAPYITGQIVAVDGGRSLSM